MAAGLDLDQGLVATLGGLTQARAGSLRAARLRLSGWLWRRPWAKGGRAARAAARLARPDLPRGARGAARLGVLDARTFLTADRPHWNLDNFRLIFSLDDTTYLRIAWTTIWVAAP